MKKLFVSVPMNDRSRTAILDSMVTLHRIAEIAVGEEFEVIDTFINDDPPETAVRPGIWYLGKSIEMMAEADALVCPADYMRFRGCEMEVQSAELYHIPIIHGPATEELSSCHDILYDSSGRLVGWYSDKKREV